MKFIPVLLSFLLLSLTSQAKVLIYRGTATLVNIAPPQNTLPMIVDFYLLVDPDTQKIASVSYYKKAKVKAQTPSSPSGASFLSAPFSGGKTQSAFTSGNVAAETDAANFNFIQTGYYGTNGTLRFMSTGFQQTVNFPEKLKGTQQILQSSTQGGGTIQILRFALRYHLARTLAVNDAGTTIAAAMTALSDELTAKGYLAP